MATDVEIDAALDAVIRAARHHRAVLKSGASTDDEIWAAYTALNNASVQYDDLMNQTYDEVTPWDCEYIDPDEATAVPSSTLGRSGVASPTVMTPLLSDDDVDEAEGQESASPAARGGGATLICVRQRRDYVVTDVEAVLGAARAARARDAEPSEEVTVGSLGEAIYTLIDAGDGTLAALDDVAEIDPGNGVILVNRTRTPLPLAELDGDPEIAFRLGRDAVLLYRLDEVMAEAEEG